MEIQTLSELSHYQYEQINQLWNQEYPLSLNNRFGILLDGATFFKHYLIENELNEVMAWAVIFEKENELRFSIIVNSLFQKQGLGKALIEKLLDNHGEFYGWVIDNHTSRKQNDELYQSPLAFYQKLGFEILTNERIDNDMLSAVKIKRNAKIHLETNRLILRELLATDVEAMYDLDSNPNVHLYLGNNPVASKEVIAEVIQFVRHQYKTNGIGRWAVIEKQSGEFIGWAGWKFLTEPQNGHQNVYDLGYRLREQFWGKGYASEACEALIKYAKNELKLEKAYASAHVNNVASNRILQKMGFENKGNFDYDGELQNWYEHSFE